MAAYLKIDKAYIEAKKMLLLVVGCMSMAMFIEKEMALEDKERLVKEINREIRPGNYVVIREV